MLRELGWTDGDNITIEYRWAEGAPPTLIARADEVIE
jgi:hypothetical protein